MGRTSVNRFVSVKRPKLDRVYNSAGVLVSTLNTFAGPDDSFYEVRITNNTPGFRSKRTRLQKDDLPMNYFLYYKEYYNRPTGYHRRDFHPNGGWETFVGGFSNANLDTRLITPDVRSRIDAAAVNASLSDLKNSKVNLGIAFAERKRTADLIVGTAKRFAAALTNLKKGSIPGALSALGYNGKRKVPKATRELSSDWLAIQYGWKPLLNDVYGLAEALAQHDRYFVRVSTSRTFRAQASNAVFPDDNIDGVPPRRIDVAQYTRKYVYIFSYTSQVSHDLSSLGLTNPLAIAWEVLPWSFAFDWLVRVGEYIDSLDATLGLQFYKGCTTTFERGRVTYSVNGTRREGNVTYHSDAKAVGEVIRCERKALNGFVHSRYPRWGTLLTPLHTANAVALSLQRFVKR